LRQERRSGDEDRGAGATSSPSKPLSRFETTACQPLWNGPPLNAAFAAQLIGQVLDTHAARDGCSAFAMYRDLAASTRALDRTA
jgi:hypothetical protein